MRNQSLKPWTLLAALGLSLGACANDPLALIPEPDRLALKREATWAPADKPLSVDQLLYRVRAGSGDAKAQPTQAMPELAPIRKTASGPVLVHLIEAGGRVSVSEAEMAAIYTRAVLPVQTTVSVGPSAVAPGSAIQAAAEARRRAQGLTALMPATVTIAEIRFDPSLPPATARLDFADERHVR
jgi:hypothetical protein